MPAALTSHGEPEDIRLSVNHRGCNSSWREAGFKSLPRVPFMPAVLNYISLVASRIASGYQSVIPPGASFMPATHN